MLILSRKAGERIHIGDYVVQVVAIRGKRVRLGFIAPAECKIRRAELPARPAADKSLQTEVTR